MTLVVEDGSGLETANSYVSLADCNTYHSDRGNSTWTGADADKEAAIIRGTQYLESHYRTRWNGVRVSRDQGLAWPRYDVVDPDGWDIDSDEVPQEVVSACCEAALRALTTDMQPDLERGGAVKSETVGPVSVTYADGASAKTKFTAIDDLLSGLVRSSSTGRLVRG